MATKNTPSDVLAFWQKRSPEPLTEEDAREIMETLHEFIDILSGWYLEDHPELRAPEEHPYAG